MSVVAPLRLPVAMFEKKEKLLNKFKSNTFHLNGKTNKRFSVVLVIHRNLLQLFRSPNYFKLLQVFISGECGLYKP